MLSDTSFRAMNDRFDYPANRSSVGSFRGYRAAIWPPSDRVSVTAVDLEAENEDLGRDFRAELTALGEIVEAQWLVATEPDQPAGPGLPEPEAISAALRRLAEHLPGEADRRALALRARAIERGYDDDILSALAGLDEDVAVVAGRIATWF